MTGALTIRAGGQISASTYSSGSGGDLNIRADSLSIDGSAVPGLFTGIVSQSNAGATGRAGDLSVDVTGAATITGGGAISATTFSSGAGGNLTVTAGFLSIDGSALPTQFTGLAAESNAGATGNAGNLTIDVANALTISGSGQISASTASSGKSGILSVTAGNLTIEGASTAANPLAFRTGILAESDGRGAGGDAGNLTVRVANALTLLDGGEISASTASSGSGGNLSVHANALTIDGSATPTQFTGLAAQSIPGATGNAGNLTVDVANALTMTGGGKITASTGSSGAGGNLNVTAGSLSIDGSAAPTEFTGIAALSTSTATGNAGSVTIGVAGALTLRGAGQISASTSSSGSGGNLNVAAGSLNIDGSATPALFTGISAQSNAGATGNAGDLTVNVANALSITATGEISASTFSSGEGGALSVTASFLTIDGTKTESNAGAGQTGIFARSNASKIGGKGGDLAVRADQMSLIGGGTISAVSLNSASSGDIDIHTGSLNLISKGSISSANLGSGAAGGVSVAARGGVDVASESSISTSALLGNAGEIRIRAGGEIELQGHSSITSSAGENGGDITLTAPGLVYLLDSAISATAGTQRTVNGGGGQGGNITIDPQFIVLDHSIISANAAVGQGGNILLDSQYYLSSESSVTATGATGGTITITSPELDLTNGLIGLSGSLLDVSTQLREQCATRLGQDFSSFLVLGQGGIDSEPDEAQASGSEEDRARRKKRRNDAENSGPSEINRQDQRTAPGNERSPVVTIPSPRL